MKFHFIEMKDSFKIYLKKPFSDAKISVNLNSDCNLDLKVHKHIHHSLCSGFPAFSVHLLIYFFYVGILYD